MICPKCKCEYQPEFKICSDCNINLVESIQLYESHDNHIKFKKKIHFKSKTKYYLFNCIWGFLGGFIIIFIATISISQNTPIPPGMRVQSRNFVSNSIYILLCYFVILIIVNVIGLFNRSKEYISTGRTNEFVKISFLNVIFFAFSFICSFILFANFITF